MYAVTRYQSANSGPQFLEIFLRKYLGVKPGITDCIDLCTTALLTRYLVIIQTDNKQTLHNLEAQTKAMKVKLYNPPFKR